MKRRLAPMATILAILLSLAPIAAAGSPTADAIGTGFLAAPALAKAAIPLGLAVGAMTGDGNYEPAAVLGLAWTIPNAFLLASIARNDASGIRLWRTVNLVVDGAMFASLFGLSAWTLAQPSTGGENWGSLVGVLGIIVSIPFGVSAGIDLIPFPAERGLR